jgi:hypothetical protein
MSTVSEDTNSSSSSFLLSSDDWMKNMTTSELQQQAQAMLEKARALKAEARALEIELKQSRATDRKTKVSERDVLIERLLPVNATSINVAGILRSERWSPEQVLLLVSRLYERQSLATGQLSSLSPIEFQIGNVRNAAVRNETEMERYGNALDTLSGAVAILDNETTDDFDSSNNANRINKNARWTGNVETALKSRLKELQRADEETVKRIMASNLNAVLNKNSSVEEYVRRTFGIGEERRSPNKKQLNISRVLERVGLVPMWVPSSFLPFLLSANTSTLGPEQVEVIKDKVLMGSRFYLTSSESVPCAAIFRGNIRTPLGGINSTDDRNHTAMVFEEIQNRLAVQGLSDQVQLFIMPDPAWRPGRDEREPQPRPVILALSKEISPDESKMETDAVSSMAKVSEIQDIVDSLCFRERANSLIARCAQQKLSYPLSLVTTFAYAVSCYSLNPKFFEALVNQNDLTVLASCIPVFLGILGIQIIQEAAHYLVAKKRRIKIGFPMPLPSPQLGIFGCITPLRSHPSSRAAVLDFALSGPFASAAISILCLVAGIFGGLRASAVDISHFPVVPSILMKSSFLIGTFVSWLSPKVMMLPLAQPVPVHPLFVVGFFGLVSAALNLLPIFRLDGGRAASAAMGSRQGGLISIFTVLLLLSVVLEEGSALSISWLLIISIFQRRPEIPARDECTEVDNVRLTAWFFSFLFSLSVLAPFPGAPGFM